MFTRKALHRLLPYLSVGGSSLSPELMIIAIRSGLICVEIPVHYGVRLGDSKITGSFNRAFRLGLSMIWLITRYRFKAIPADPTLQEKACSAKAR
jgi:hypothetical protein